MSVYFLAFDCKSVYVLVLDCDSVYFLECSPFELLTISVNFKYFTVMVFRCSVFNLVDV